MQIAAVGYYGFGNAGDEALLENLRYVFSPHAVVPIPVTFSASEADIERLNAYDFVILGAGGLYNKTPARPFDSFDRWQQLLRTPIGVVGLGVEQLDERDLPATRRLVEHAAFFVVRDAESARLIGHSGVQVAPDLTFFRPLPLCAYPPGNPRPRAGVNLRPAGRHTPAWIDAVRALPCDTVAMPFSMVPTWDDRDLLRAVDAACPDRFQPEVYRSLDLFIGTAFHSIVFAIQSGVPAIAISYHNKVRRLMEEAGLGDYVLMPDQADRLPSCYERLLAGVDAVRSKMVVHRDTCRADWDRRAPAIRDAVAEAAAHRSSARLPRAAGAPAQPLVTILVHAAENDRDEDLARTIDACRAQTYPNIELLVFDSARGRPESGTSAAREPAVTDRAAGDGDWVVAGLAAAAGGLVTWLDTGSRFAPDAIAALAGAAQRSDSGVGAVAPHYLTGEGVIHRKIGFGNGLVAERFSGGLRCFLIRKQEAPLLRQLQLQPGATPGALSSRLVPISHGLLFVPSTQSEMDLYHAGVAYGRGRDAEGGRLLDRALAEDPALGSAPLKQELAFEAFLDGACDPHVSEDPARTLMDVCGKLPSKTGSAPGFRKAFRARTLLEAAWITKHRGRRWLALLLLLRALAGDARWRRNRGVQIFFVRTLLGERVISWYRSAREALSDRRSRGRLAAQRGTGTAYPRGEG